MSGLKLCSSLPFDLALLAVILLPSGLAIQGYFMGRRKGWNDFDRSAWLLMSLFITALASMGVFIFFIFSHFVSC